MTLTEVNQKPPEGGSRPQEGFQWVVGFALSKLMVSL